MNDVLRLLTVREHGFATELKISQSVTLELVFDGSVKKHCFSAKGAPYTSPGQRPGFVSKEELRALKGRHNRCFALSGVDGFLAIEPRAMPWAISLHPFGAATKPADFASALGLEQAIKANLRGLGYGG